MTAKLYTLRNRMDPEFRDLAEKDRATLKVEQIGEGSSSIKPPTWVLLPVLVEGIDGGIVYRRQAVGAGVVKK